MCASEAERHGEERGRSIMEKKKDSSVHISSLFRLCHKLEPPPNWDQRTLSCTSHKTECLRCRHLRKRGGEEERHPQLCGSRSSALLQGEDTPTCPTPTTMTAAGQARRDGRGSGGLSHEPRQGQGSVVPSPG